MDFKPRTTLSHYESFLLNLLVVKERIYTNVHTCLLDLQEINGALFNECRSSVWFSDCYKCRRCSPPGIPLMCFECSLAQISLQEDIIFDIGGRLYSFAESRICDHGDFFRIFMCLETLEMTNVSVKNPGWMFPGHMQILGSRTMLKKWKSATKVVFEGADIFPLPTVELILNFVSPKIIIHGFLHK